MGQRSRQAEPERLRQERPLQRDRPARVRFATSPVLQVPGDWNSQRENLLFYEGLLWYQKDFTYQPKPGMRTFMHLARPIIAPQSL